VKLQRDEEPGSGIVRPDGHVAERPGDWADCYVGRLLAITVQCIIAGILTACCIRARSTG